MGSRSNAPLSRNGLRSTALFLPPQEPPWSTRLSFRTTLYGALSVDFYQHLNFDSGFRLRYVHQSARGGFVARVTHCYMLQSRVLQVFGLLSDSCSAMRCMRHHTWRKECHIAHNGATRSESANWKLGRPLFAFKTEDDYMIYIDEVDI